MKIGILILTALLVIAACGDDRVPVVAEPTITSEPTPKPVLELLDLTETPPLTKGRFQDGETADGRPNHLAKAIVAQGKNAIPFLIGKLDDETELPRPVTNFWYRQFVGDVALIILIDLFQDRSEVNSTIPGFGWDEFLERGGDGTLMGEEVLRRYIRKHGRKTIKQRWQKMWDQNKDKIFWDERCYCFKLGP